MYQNGADLRTKNNKGSTPILLAALNGHFRVVKYLHKHGKIEIKPNKNGTKCQKEIHRHRHNHFPIFVRIVGSRFHFWQNLKWSYLIGAHLVNVWGKRFMLPQLTHESFLTIDHSCKVFFWYLPNWTSTNLWCVVL